MELLIVDDGSTDDTPAICDALAAQHTCIRVIHQANHGLSAARNTGIASALGDVITFVDSDDWLLPGTYRRLLTLFAYHHDWDILEYSYCRSEGTTLSEHTLLPEAVYTSVADYWLRGEAYCHLYAWNKLFQRHLFHPAEGTGLRFSEGKVFEDVTLFAEIISRQYTIATYPILGYVYRYNPCGITAQASTTAIAQLLDANITAMTVLRLCPEGRSITDKHAANYYLSVVNIQITLCRMSGEPPRLPSYRVPITIDDLRQPVRLMKKLILALFGLTTLCRLLSLCHLRSQPR